MSSPDHIDERFDNLVRELRAGHVAASPELRERVREISARAPEAPRRRAFLEHFSWRRAVLVAAPVCVLAGVSAALLQGFTSSASQSSQALEPLPPVHEQARDADASVGGFVGANPRAARSSFEGLKAAPPPSNNRLEDYRVNLHVRVSGNDALSRATVRAMRVTRNLGGYVASVRYSTPSVRDGDAVLILRVPIRHVQRAILAYNGLGTLVAQNFSVIDLQKQYDGQIERAAKLRARIAKLEAQLTTEALADVERARIREQLEYARSELTILTRQTSTTLNRGRLATARLSLTTFHAKEKREVAPVPSRFDRMLDDVGNVLAHEAVWALYGLFVAGPFLLLGALVLAAERSRRRRAEQRLLAAS